MGRDILWCEVCGTPDWPWAGCECDKSWWDADPDDEDDWDLDDYYEEDDDGQFRIVHPLDRVNDCVA